MDTNDIRRIVEEKIDEESRTNVLRDHYLENISTDEAARSLTFIKHYLRMTPDLMETTHQAACRVNLEDMYQPIYNSSFNYWETEYDFIPDNFGISGICDDAYLTLSLMQLIADSVVPSTGSPLIQGFDIKNKNEMMGSIIGNGIQLQLDAVISTTFSSVQTQNSMNDLFAAALGGNFFGGMGAYQTADMRAMDQMLKQQTRQDDITRDLGAIGIF